MLSWGLYFGRSSSPASGGPMTNAITADTSLLAGAPAGLVDSPKSLGTPWRNSVQGRNPAGEDALVQIKPIRDVRKLQLPIKHYEGY
jgi:hypothetical protein